MTWRRILWAAAGLLVLLGAVLGSFYRPDIPRDQMRERWGGDGSQFLPVQGTEVHVRDHRPPGPGGAEAATLVLMHGTASSLHTWDGWVDELASDYRIVRFDLQGYGLTGPNPEQDYSIDRQIRVGEELLGRLGVGRATLGGNSLGGLVAWRWALAHPERAERLILVAAAGYPQPVLSGPATPGEEAPKPRRNALSLGEMPVVKDLITKITPRSLVENALEDVYGKPERLDERVVQRHYEMLLAEGNRLALRHALAGRGSFSQDLWKKIPTLEMPALILWGGRDDWIPPAAARKFHDDLPHSELVIYPDAGHVPMEEMAETTARDVGQWLRATAPR